MTNLRKTAAFTAALIFIASNTSITPVSAEDTKISQLLDVSQFAVRDENLVYIGADYLRDVSYLFNDQDKVPQDINNFSVDSDTFSATSRLNWNPNWQSEFGEDLFYVDFGANYVITDIAFLDTNGTPTWTVYSGEPFNWTKIAEMNMDWYNSWRKLTVENPQPTRYMRFSCPTGDSGVSEIAFYGYKASELSKEQQTKTAPKSSAVQSKLTAGQTAGFNAFIDDPITSIMAAGNIREYHNFNWLIDNTGKVKFTQGTWGDMDSYYTELKKLGISAIPCFQGGSSVISGESASVPEIPVASGADTLEPKSYAIHAQAMYQVAARYGSNADIDLSTINITDAQEVKVGMGLLDALENSNEPNKTWSGKASYFTPYELAAMCSADYDGHEGTIPNAGVKTADPDFRLAMGGLLGTATLTEYLDEMKLWFDYNRSDGKFAVDIINVHIGPDDYCVENSNFRHKIAELKKWIEENAPNTELWISEFEVPMSDCEIEGTDNHDNENYQLKYAQRVTRTYLAAMAEGADRVTKFQLRDEGEGVYYNSGLVTGKGEWNKKTAWYHLACMTNALKNADFVSEENISGVNVYTFRDRTNGNIIKAVWSPTNEDKVIKNFSLDSYGYAYITEPSDLVSGQTKELKSNNGKITFEVSETPVYITLSENPVNFDRQSFRISPELISLEKDKSGETCGLEKAPENAVLNQFYRMFDEPDTMPSVIYGDTSGLGTPETNVNKSGITSYVYFKEPQIFNGFAVYDTYGTGNISVYNAYTDELLWESNLGSYMSRSISVTEDSAPTDCLKIVKQGGDLNELAFYGYFSGEKSYDVNMDGRISVYDLTAMRKKLVSGNTGYTAANLVGLSKFLLNQK